MMKDDSREQFIGVFTDDELRQMITPSILERNPVEITNSTEEAINSWPVDQIGRILKGMFLNEKDMVAKARIFDAIKKNSGYDFVGFLLELYETRSQGWRCAFIRELGEFEDARGIQKLCSILRSDSDPDARYLATQSLGEVGDESVLEVLEYAQKFDEGTDFEGRPISQMAEKATARIIERKNSRRQFHHQKLPNHSDFLSGREPPNALGFRSDKLQIWYNNTNTPWKDDGLHAHTESDECFIVLKGALIVELEDRRVRVEAGEFCCFPIGFYHAVVDVETPAETLMIRAPSINDKVYK